MKKYLILSLFTLLLVYSCSNKKQFIGKWERTENMWGSVWKSYMTLYEDGSMNVELMDLKTDGTWELKGDTLITHTEEGRTTVHYKIVRINNKELFLKYKDSVREYYRVEKQE